MGLEDCNTEQSRLVKAVKAACIRTALEGYQQAGMAGLCHEGAWEAAVSAMQMLDVNALLKEDGGLNPVPQNERR